MEVPEERNGHASNGVTKPSSPATSNGYQNGDSHQIDHEVENADNMEDMGMDASVK